MSLEIVDDNEGCRKCGGKLTEVKRKGFEPLDAQKIVACMNRQCAQFTSRYVYLEAKAPRNAQVGV